MSTDPDVNEFTILDDKRAIILTLCSNFLANKLDELYVESSFTSTDLLLLLDDLMTELFQLILNQIKQLNSELGEYPRARSCISMVIANLKNSWDKGLERIANKIVRSQMNDKIILQTFNQIEKFQKNQVTTIFYSLKKCLEKI